MWAWSLPPGPIDRLGQMLCKAGANVFIPGLAERGQERGQKQMNRGDFARADGERVWNAVPDCSFCCEIDRLND